MYGKAGCMSSSFWWDDNDFQKNVVTSSVPSDPKPQIYMDSGTGSVGEAECTAHTLDVYSQLVGDGFEETSRFGATLTRAPHTASPTGALASISPFRTFIRRRQSRA